MLQKIKITSYAIILCLFGLTLMNEAFANEKKQTQNFGSSKSGKFRSEKGAPPPRTKRAEKGTQPAGDLHAAKLQECLDFSNTLRSNLVGLRNRINSYEAFVDDYTSFVEGIIQREGNWHHTHPMSFRLDHEEYIDAIRRWLDDVFLSNINNHGVDIDCLADIEGAGGHHERVHTH
jgi:hypothetical protein